jgi:hypothetical protein
LRLRELDEVRLYARRSGEDQVAVANQADLADAPSEEVLF